MQMHWPRLRVWLRLKPGASRARMVLQLKNDAASTLMTNVVHRFEESIAGRPYLIQVAAVSPDRLRADIVRVPGARSALMPFYGRTPDEAAGLLTAWLKRAYRCTPGAGTIGGAGGQV